ncbi:DNA polymerase III subunit chi [Gemmobacter serpentinus]|uniref:DNA polymerase III subunit chi n=1 Tax=Gemmobacter serpentinus TaxID=2652247 RepID=UPI00124F4143|nr:DNA polymerase III subunit chi [Gemmobacter serpentinus]
MPVLFYHITRSSVEDTARTLMERALGAGWRVMLRGSDPARLQHLDDWLWLNPDDGFLPHGLAGGPRDGDQPILLGQGAAMPGTKAVLLIDGAEPLPGEAEAMERVWVLFDGHDGGAVNRARGLWKAITAAGTPAQYWSEEAGRWEKKAESGT